MGEVKEAFRGFKAGRITCSTVTCFQRRELESESPGPKPGSCRVRFKTFPDYDFMNLKAATSAADSMGIANPVEEEPSLGFIGRFLALMFCFPFPSFCTISSTIGFSRLPRQLSTATSC